MDAIGTRLAMLLGLAKSGRRDRRRKPSLWGSVNLETLELRELRYAIVEKGKRTKSITVVTTLTDVDAYTKEDIAELYGYRWSSEVYQTDCTSSAGLYQLAA